MLFKAGKASSVNKETGGTTFFATTAAAVGEVVAFVIVDAAVDAVDVMDAVAVMECSRVVVVRSFRRNGDDDVCNLSVSLVPVVAFVLLDGVVAVASVVIEDDGEGLQWLLLSP